MAEPRGWLLAEVGALVRAQGATAVAREHLARRAQAAGPEAWISTVGEADLLARAEGVDTLLADGVALPLAGVPFAVKDNIDVAGVPTTAACAPFAYVAARSAPVVAAFLRAGALYVGKTNLDQFATGLVGTRSPQFGTCRNPHEPSFVAGGSSSGSAVVVAHGEVPLAFGTDTAGSGRVPAANCGVVGLKPTPGLLPTDGIVPAMPSYDCVSLFASAIGDARAAFEVLHPPGDLERPRRARRVGVPRGLEWFGDGDARDQFALACDRLVALGCELVEVDGDPLWQIGALLYGSALVAARAVAFGAAVDAHPAAVHPAVREIVRRARAYPATEVYAALDDVRRHRATVDEWWQVVDVLVLPTVARVPTVAEAEQDLLGPSAELGRLTSFANPLGLPVVAVPSGVRTSGVPFGVSFAGPARSERTLLALAEQFTGAPAGDRVAEGASDPELFPIVVAGAHLAGQPLHHQLAERGARLLQRTTTAPRYRLFALDTTPAKPGLVRAPVGGAAIEVEVWALDGPGFASFVAAIPAPLGVGKVELADGASITGFLCEEYALAGAHEISDHGGWRAYLAHRGPGAG